MSVIEAVITRLRSSTTRFEDRIAGLAELNDLREKQNLACPAAFVLPGGESVGGHQSTGGIDRTFEITQTYQILVWLDANADPRNAEPTYHLDAIRTELIEALLPWRPTDGHSGFRYTGMEVGGQDQDRAIYLFNFNTRLSLWDACGDSLLTTGIDPAVKMAKSMGKWYRAPAINPETCEPVHEAGVGVHLFAAPCNPEDPCEPATQRFSTQLREGQNASDDACEST